MVVFVLTNHPAKEFIKDQTFLVTYSATGRMSYNLNCGVKIVRKGMHKPCQIVWKISNKPKLCLLKQEYKTTEEYVQRCSVVKTDNNRMITHSHACKTIHS
jgi:hypothetical protein